MARKTRRANGEGTVFFNNTINKWQYTFPLSSGKTKTVTGLTQKEVIKKRKEYIKNNKNNNLRQKLTLLEIITDYVEYKHSSNVTNDNSYLTDLDTIKRLKTANFIEKSVNLITIEELKEYLSSISKYSKSIIKKNWSLLRNGFKIAQDKGVINYNLMNSIEIKKPKSIKKQKKVIALTLMEQQKFVEVIKNLKKEHEYQNIWLIMLYSGMRIGEVLALQRDDINLTEKIITINKTLTRDSNKLVIVGETTKTPAGERTIRITATLEKVIKKSIENYKENENNLIFCKSNGNIITGNMVNLALKRFCKTNDISLKISNHILRHTYATRMIEAGVPPHVLQKLLGHEDISITLNTYTDIFEKYEKSYDKIIQEYYDKNNLIVEKLELSDIVKNELDNIYEIIYISHINEKQKNLLNQDIKKIKEWYNFL